MTIRKYVYQLYPIYLGASPVRRIYPAPIAQAAGAVDVYPWKP
jgi:hypothetical protein